MNFKILDQEVPFSFEGKPYWGEPRVLLNEDDDLTRDTDWTTRGYTKLSLFSQEEIENLREQTREILDEVHFEVTKTHFPSGGLEDLHKVFSDEETFRSFCKASGAPFDFERFAMNLKELNGRISAMAKTPLQLAGVEAHPEICIRVIRPESYDFNPLHRDAWIDRLRNTLNCFIPIAGNNTLSTLTIIPQSHRIRDDQFKILPSGSLVNNHRFSVPAIVDSKKRLNLYRPSLNEGEALLFSPYLVHGLGYNFQRDKTRVSIEARFRRRA